MSNQLVGDNWFLPNKRIWLKTGLYLTIAALFLLLLEARMYAIYVGLIAFIVLLFGTLDYLSTSKNALLLNDEGIDYDTISTDFSTSWENIESIQLRVIRFAELQVTTKDKRYCYLRLGYYKKETVIEIASLLKQKANHFISDDIKNMAEGNIPLGVSWSL